MEMQKKKKWKNEEKRREEKVKECGNVLKSPDDTSLYLFENNCICLCAYEIGGVEGGLCLHPLKFPSANRNNFKQTTRFRI